MQNSKKKTSYCTYKPAYKIFVCITIKQRWIMPTCANTQACQNLCSHTKNKDVDEDLYKNLYLLPHWISQHGCLKEALSRTVNVLKFGSLFHFCSRVNCWFIRAGIHKMLVKIANRGDLDQTASSEAV